MKPGPKENARVLLTIWRGSRDMKNFREIVKAAEEQLNLKRRTVIKHLNKLVQQGILEKHVDIKRNTFYKPKNMQELEKALIKENVEKLPLVITPGDLKLIVPGMAPQWYEGAHFSAASESETVKKWRELLAPQITQYIKDRHPELKRLEVEREVERIRRPLLMRFFNRLELNMRLNIFSDLKLPPIDTSKWHVFRGKVEKGLYAKVWAHLFEAAAILLFEIYKQHPNLEEFLRETEGKKLMFSFEITPTFQWIPKYVGQEWFKE